ncbi:CPBP family intramembrane glutamic endopeptidase [Salinilacihabitans rarus]|uniref:CPBP family intramembrane glutamic endopeptidase n=1 Tax=Salinilacihabitans rarus TaxID=2961596 RepID=UPI0020C914DF|nr:CPBP family intramembrane glutamic endopeptidase [Salinilacihabitans rarus]
MTQWTTFAGLTGVVLALLLALSVLTQREFAASESSGREPSPTDRVSTGSVPGPAAPDRPADARAATGPDAVSERAEDVGGPGSRADGAAGPSATDPRNLSTGALLANVALSQGVFAAVLFGAAVYTGVPAAALGISFDAASLANDVVVGVGLGAGLYVANELGAAAAKRLGVDHDEELRELLAPDSAGGWLVLLLVVLPVIAAFEEFLFRAALIGAFSAGFGLSPWLLVVGSSVAFAAGHGMQGTAGVAVTGLLGLVLGAAFVLTGSLLVVVVAHYLVNAVEFVVHEGLGIEWAATTES